MLFTFSLRRYWPLEFWSFAVAQEQKLSLNKCILYLLSFFGPKTLNTQHFVLNILLSINMNLITSHLSMYYIPICFKNLGILGKYFFRYWYLIWRNGFLPLECWEFISFDNSEVCNVQIWNQRRCNEFCHSVWQVFYSFSKLEILICFESRCS